MAAKVAKGLARARAAVTAGARAAAAAAAREAATWKPVA
jgi:hypothetical protein